MRPTVDAPPTVPVLDATVVAENERPPPLRAANEVDDQNDEQHDDTNRARARSNASGSTSTSITVISDTAWRRRAASPMLTAINICWSDDCMSGSRRPVAPTSSTAAVSRIKDRVERLAMTHPMAAATALTTLRSTT